VIGAWEVDVPKRLNVLWGKNSIWQFKADHTCSLFGGLGIVAKWSLSDSQVQLHIDEMVDKIRVPCRDSDFEGNPVPQPHFGRRRGSPLRLLTTGSAQPNASIQRLAPDNSATWHKMPDLSIAQLLTLMSRLRTTRRSGSRRRQICRAAP